MYRHFAFPTEDIAGLRFGVKIGSQNHVIRVMACLLKPNI